MNSQGSGRTCKTIIEFVVLLYIPLVPSLNNIVGLVTDEYVGNIDTVV
jgi:hypothetical protein